MVKEITVKLHRKMSCSHFESGVITTFVKKEKVATLDYGIDGECDKAVWTDVKTGKTKTITLKSGVHWFSVKK